MAREKTFDERRREREELDGREQQEQELSLAQRRGAVAALRTEADSLKAVAGNGSTDKLLELFKRAEPLIEQLNNLYNQYVAGIEKRPPIERRQQLDQIMTALQMMSKPTPSYQFRYNTLNASYMTHRERWERMLLRR